MEVLFFRLGPVMYGLPTEQIRSLESKSAGMDLGALLDGTGLKSTNEGRCVKLHGETTRTIRIGDVVGIFTVGDDSVRQLPPLVQKHLKTRMINGVIRYREENALLLDLRHVVQ